MLLSEAFNLYARDVMYNQSRKTEEHHFCALKSLVTYIGNPDVDELTLDQIRKYQYALERRGLSSGTIRGYLNRLTVVLGWLRANDIPCLNPALIRLPKRRPVVPDFLTPQEVSRLIRITGFKSIGYSEVNKKRNQAIMALLFASGIRVTELINLNRDALYENSFTVIGKGQKARLCFCDARAERLIKEYLSLRPDTNPAMFVTKTGKRVTKSSVDRIFQIASVKFGKRVYPHKMRHSFATDLLRNNTNMRLVQEFLGHSSLETTQIYTHVVNADLKAVYAEKHSV